MPVGNANGLLWWCARWACLMRALCSGAVCWCAGLCCSPSERARAEGDKERERCPALQCATLPPLEYGTAHYFPPPPHQPSELCQGLQTRRGVSSTSFPEFVLCCVCTSSSVSFLSPEDARRHAERGKERERGKRSPDGLFACDSL